MYMYVYMYMYVFITCILALVSACVRIYVFMYVGVVGYGDRREPTLLTQLELVLSRVEGGAAIAQLVPGL